MYGGFFKAVTDFIIDTCPALQRTSKLKPPIDWNMIIPLFFATYSDRYILLITK